MKVHLTDLELLGFYPYTSHVHDVLCEYDDFIHKSGDKWAKRLYDEIVSYLNDKFGYFKYQDNKSAYKVKHKATGTIFYVGIYDSHYYIGLSCVNEYDRYIDLTEIEK